MGELRFLVPASRGRVGASLDLPGAVMVTAECCAATNAGVALSNSASDATPKNRRHQTRRSRQTEHSAAASTHSYPYAHGERS